MRMDQMWRTARQNNEANRTKVEGTRTMVKAMIKAWNLIRNYTQSQGPSPWAVWRTRLMRTRRIWHALRRSGHRWQSVRTIGWTTMHGWPRREPGTALGRRIHAPALTEVCRSRWAAAEVLVVVVVVAAPTATAIIGHTRHVGRRPVHRHIRVHRHVPRHRRAGSSSASTSTSTSTRVEMQRRQDGEI
jgi:hypothetical protein